MERTRFPNLARHICERYPAAEKPAMLPDAEETARLVNEQITAELVAAGIPDVREGDRGILDRSFGKLEMLRLPNGYFPEVPSGLTGYIHRWTFERAWRYYVAKGPGIPPAEADEFDREWGSEARADGDCACRGAAFWSEGFGTGVYHIDTAEGLGPSSAC